MLHKMSICLSVTCQYYTNTAKNIKFLHTKHYGNIPTETP